MPDLVMREILNNLDFVSICKLRRVCHAFRDFIDCVKPDNNLNSIDLQVEADKIVGRVRVQKSSPSLLSKPVKFDYKEKGDRCVVRSGGRKDIFPKNFVDMCIDDFLWCALTWNGGSQNTFHVKHQKSVLGELCVTKKSLFDKNDKPVLQTAGKFVVPAFDKVFDGLMEILESRDRLLQVESLKMSVHGQEQLMQLLTHVDLNVLKSLQVFRLLETKSISDHGEDNSQFVLDLEILKDCKNLEHLRVTRFSISSPFRMFTHIPNLTVNMQTVYCEDVIRFKNTMENSDINAHSEIRFGQFPDKFRFLEAIGLAQDGGGIVFPSKLSLTYWPASKSLNFSWKHTS
ncbi:hypothetical protein GCK72_021441 [Caenorhabditis remanei]|uniref:F-box domain-containing protein n=1 Tax=Caenorhabditis remanei TaxID=31234 RepID=A0A6A5GJU8_CAERE|nr:hypothetical protein GCK72_021441 [Caenorhabditis remanei]KAF1754876.1 hypothetical protein GCK72_021441 [Caenorhabditis remanei]